MVARQELFVFLQRWTLFLRCRGTKTRRITYLISSAVDLTTSRPVKGKMDKYVVARSKNTFLKCGQNLNLKSKKGKRLSGAKAGAWAEATRSGMATLRVRVRPKRHHHAMRVLHYTASYWPFYYERFDYSFETAGSCVCTLFYPYFLHLFCRLRLHL